MRHVDTPTLARALATEILGERARPLVLISTGEDDEPGFDVRVVERELGPDADVVTIRTGESTFALEGILPAKCNAYGGAARSFPTDFGANPDWRRSILRFPDRHTADELIEDALTQIPARTVVSRSSGRKWVTATIERVSGVTGNVARLANGTQVVVVADNVPHRFPLGEGLVVGQLIEGWLTDHDLAPEPEDAGLAGLTEGATTLARVVRVTEQRAYLSLHPTAEPIALRRRDLVPGSDEGLNADVRVPDVVRVGETVRARVTRTSPALGLSLVDVDAEAELVPAPPLLRGGPSWLREGVHAVTAPAEALEPEAEPAAAEPMQDRAATPPPAPVADTSAILDLSVEVHELRAAVMRLGRELRSGTDVEVLERFQDESEALSAELNRERALRQERDATIGRLRQQLREARPARSETSGGTRTERSSWPHGEDWLRHEILTTWAARTTAADKALHPLGSYTIGARLLASLDELDATQLDKALRAIADVVSGRAATIPGRQVHRLRQGQGGGDPFVVRSDGAACWRAAIEVNAPSARRLHYWQLPGGAIELGRVVLHDDVEP